LKTGIAAEAEVILLGNGLLAPVPAATDNNKDIPMTTNRITKDNKLFDMVTCIRATWQM
jgi:hypothetical protein